MARSSSGEFCPRCLGAVAFGASLEAPPELPASLSPGQVAQLASEGKIRHSLVIAGLFFFEQWRKDQRQTATP